MTETQEIKRLLVEVQSQLAYQEDTMQALNEALAGQQQEILVLRRQLQLLKQHQDEGADDAPASGPPAQEKPPHY